MGDVKYMSAATAWVPTLLSAPHIRDSERNPVHQRFGKEWVTWEPLRNRKFTLQSRHETPLFRITIITALKKTDVMGSTHAREPLYLFFGLFRRYYILRQPRSFVADKLQCCPNQVQATHSNRFHTQQERRVILLCWSRVSTGIVAQKPWHTLVIRYLQYLCDMKRHIAAHSASIQYEQHL